MKKPFQTIIFHIHLIILKQTKLNLLNSLHHVVSLTSSMPLSTERSFSRLRWKSLSFFRRVPVNPGPLQPPKHGRALCWPSSQRANWCWQSHICEQTREANNLISNNIYIYPTQGIFWNYIGGDHLLTHKTIYKVVNNKGHLTHTNEQTVTILCILFKKWYLNRNKISFQFLFWVFCH